MVIRVQDEFGDGPYIKPRIEGLCERHSDEPFSAMFWYHCEDIIHHPNWNNDCGHEESRYRNENELFAFATWKQFIDWFTAEEIILLACNGYYPVIIDVEPTVIGDKQCLFQPEDVCVTS